MNVINILLLIIWLFLALVVLLGTIQIIPQLLGKTPKNKDDIQGYLVIIFLAVVGFFYLKGPLQYYKFKKNYRKEFSPYINSYTPFAAKGRRSTPCISGEAIILIIDEKTGANRISKINFDLLKEKQVPIARNPQLIGTAIMLQYGRNHAGTYTDGASAYILRCDITLINTKTGAYSETESIYGGSPPGHKVGSGSRSGSPPSTKAIRKFLKGLPICNDYEKKLAMIIDLTPPHIAPCDVIRFTWIGLALG